MTAVLRASAGYGQIDFALARIHGVLGGMPTESVWTALTAIEKPDHFLEAAAKQGLGRWLQGVRPGATAHDIEGPLRQRHRDEMIRLGRWSPPEYRPLLDWFALLPYLDFVGYLYRGEPAREWMQEDVLLADWLANGQEAFGIAALQSGLETGHGRHQVANNWVEGVFSRLPHDLSMLAEDRVFSRLLGLLVDSHPLHDMGRAPEQRFSQRLLLEAHRHAMTPPLILVYAMLVHWLLLRLRAELVIRVTALPRD